MPDTNKVELSGELSRDPHMKYLPSGTPLAEFGLLVVRSYATAGGEQREDSCLVDCAAFGRLAETANEAKKGDRVRVRGRLKFDQWEDHQGNKRSKLSVVIDFFKPETARPAAEPWDVVPSE